MQNHIEPFITNMYKLAKKIISGFDGVRDVTEAVYFPIKVAFRLFIKAFIPSF